MRVWISDNDLLKLAESVDEARNIRMSTKRTHLRVHPIYIPALATAPSARRNARATLRFIETNLRPIPDQSTKRRRVE